MKNKKAIANSDLLQDIDRLSDDQSSMKEKLKVDAQEDYSKTGEKKLLGGLGIRVGSFLNYDEKQAFSWAKEHSLCLSLDKKAFEKIAKSQDLDFVKKEEKVVVTFPKMIKL